MSLAVGHRRPPRVEGAEPLARARMFNIACAGLITLTVVQASRANARETLHSTARDGGHAVVAGQAPGLSVGDLPDMEAEGDHAAQLDDGTPSR